MPVQQLKVIWGHTLDTGITLSSGTGNSVHFATIPVNSYTICSFVDYFNNRSVSFSDSDLRPRKAVVHCQYALSAAQLCEIRLLQLQPQEDMELMNRLYTKIVTT